jgi:hypothetical protein
MDHYDKAQSVNNESTTTPPPAVAHVSGVPEFPGCLSDLYAQYMSAPTREIINAIEGMGLTRNGADMTQLLQAILSTKGGQTLEAVQGSIETDVTPQTLNIATGYTLAEINEVHGSLWSYMEDGTGSPATDRINVDFTFLKDSGGVWTSSATGMITSTFPGFNEVYIPSTGVTSVTGSRNVGGARVYGYDVVITDNNIKIEATNGATIGRFGLTGRAILKN